MLLPINKLKVMIPVKKADEVGVRKIMEISEMEEVLEILSSEEKFKMPTNWNRRYRFNLDKIKSGNLIEIAGVIKSLEKLDSKKSLSTGERKILNEARIIIISEMALVFDKDVDEVVSMVDEAIFG